MKGDEQGSVTRWIAELKGGDRQAVQPLWERYFGRMAELARARLRAVRLKDAGRDEEDAALSAFDSLCAGVAGGRFPQLDDRDDLWRLLVVITSRKVLIQARRQLRQKRGGGNVRVASDLAVAGSGDDDDDHLLARVVSTEPTPEFAAMVAEEYRRLLDRLGNDALRRVAILRAEGATGDEIAAKLGCTRRTVVRQLSLIRRTLAERSS
jgi:DNA-directed RNA polymerase specialized sigma24 family protein